MFSFFQKNYVASASSTKKRFPNQCTFNCLILKAMSRVQKNCTTQIAAVESDERFTPDWFPVWCESWSRIFIMVTQVGLIIFLLMDYKIIYKILLNKSLRIMRTSESDSRPRLAELGRQLFQVLPQLPSPGVMLT